jgi:transcriptional regulator with XRE-family HTH domain
MFGTTAFPAGIFASVSDLAERVQWILNNRHRPDGKLWKAKPLSKEAGLGETHVGMIARGDVTNVKTETVYAIARAAGVSGAWLLTGKGSPDEEIEDDSAYTSVTNRSVGHLAEPVAAYEPVRTRIADLPNVVELLGELLLGDAPARAYLPDPSAHAAVQLAHVHRSGRSAGRGRANIHL